MQMYLFSFVTYALIFTGVNIKVLKIVDRENSFNIKTFHFVIEN